jgi:hypothetical protein
VIDIIEKRSRAGVTNTDLIKRCHSAEPEPLTNVGDDEMRTILQDVISQLPPVREQVVRLRYYEKRDKTFRIGTPIRKVSWTKRFAAEDRPFCSSGDRVMPPKTIATKQTGLPGEIFLPQRAA